MNYFAEMIEKEKAHGEDFVRVGLRRGDEFFHTLLFSLQRFFSWSGHD